MKFPLPIPVPPVQWSFNLVSGVNPAMPAGQQVTLKEPPATPLVGQLYLLVAFPMAFIGVLRVQAADNGEMVLAPVTDRWFSDRSEEDKQELMKVLCRVRGIEYVPPAPAIEYKEHEVVLPGVSDDNWEDGNRAQVRQKENSNDQRSS